MLLKSRQDGKTGSKISTAVGKRLGTGLLAAVFLLGLLFNCNTVLAAQKVVIAEMNWSGAIAVSHVMKQVLEDKLGVSAQLQQLNPALTWAGMEKGSVDVFPDLWWPNQNAGIEKYVEKKKAVELTLSFDNAAQGWFIPTWAAEKYGIHTLADLKDPEKAKIFDMTGNGIGDIWAGGFGWMSTEITKVQLRDFGLPLENYVVDQWVFLTSLKEAMRQKKPMLFYYWSPEWPFAVYDLTKLELPAYDPEKWVYVDKKPEESKITCDWQPAKVYVGYSAKLKKKSPKAFQFFKQWNMPIEEVNAMISSLEEVPGNPKQDPEKVAGQWIADHPQIVNQWIKGIK
ncbi:glycine betaine ABC transporter substrate-binding protein [Desulfospira joergensenii]|uniref:glycine betaine ABC transporter substrate-binding protein n=1 Tax=Desulfospira joergensenii TaxID=53329 RepID=UPI0003B3184B|nr:glycine betaine ABC transporter substrate-binding protein [Desulfospira joergensenii]